MGVEKFKKSLFFTAIIPQEPLRSKIQELKQYVKTTYDSAHSLNAPPHITLLSPFRMETEKQEPLNSMLEAFSQSISPFEITLNDFSTFPPKVIFIDVHKTPKLLHLQTKLEELARSKPDLFNYNYDDRPYHPHLTLAFKDLTKANFRRAWKEFKDQKFDESFTVEQISLLRHNGERWEVVREFQLG